MQNIIKELRMVEGITQEELAEKANVSRQTIVSLEKGKYKPSIVLAYKIAKIFNKTIEEVFIIEESDLNE